MARTVDEEAHTRRREAFLDAAEELMLTQDSEAITVAELVKATAASKGAFYHYFDSKDALMDALLHRMLDRIVAAITPIADEGTLTAPDKITALIEAIAVWKGRHRHLLVAATTIWHGADNAHARSRLRRRTADEVGAVMATIVAQGNAEGSFEADEPTVAGRLTYLALQELNDEVRDRLSTRRHDPTALDGVVERFEAYSATINRMLGAPVGTIRLASPDQLRRWYAQVFDRGAIDDDTTQ